jgi:hypothetical protein
MDFSTDIAAKGKARGITFLGMEKDPLPRTQ